MSFNPNKTPIEIIKEGAFGGTYFRDIYSNINGKWYRNSWKEFDFLRGIDPKYVAHLYDFGKIKVGFVNKILMDSFNRIVNII